MTKHQRISRFVEDIRTNHSNISTEELIALLSQSKRIYNNKIVLESLILALKTIMAKDLKLRNTLTDREREVVKLIGTGLTNKEIAHSLSLSPTTIETHRKNIRKKLQLRGNDNLFAFALIFQIQQSNRTTL